MLNISSKSQNRERTYFPFKSVLLLNVLKTSIPTVCTNTILAPINRIKILLQVMGNISINESEKEYKVRKLLPSIIKHKKNQNRISK